MLSIVDLMEAGTISAEAAGFCIALIHEGSSFFTGAVPGGAGKTTIMAALLGLLPPVEKIITAADRSAIAEAADAASSVPVCLLAHEVGAGSWYAYVWGESAAEFVKAREAGARIVTTLHADTPRQVRGVLGRAGIEESRPAAQLQIFIRKLPDRRRRVASVCFDSGGEMQPVFEWDSGKDRLLRTMSPDEMAEKASITLNTDPAETGKRWTACTGALRRLREKAIREFRAVSAEFADSPATASLQ